MFHFWIVAKKKSCNERCSVVVIVLFGRYRLHFLEQRLRNLTGVELTN